MGGVFAPGICVTEITTVVIIVMKHIVHLLLVGPLRRRLQLPLMEDVNSSVPMGNVFTPAGGVTEITTVAIIVMNRTVHPLPERVDLQ